MFSAISNLLNKPEFGNLLVRIGVGLCDRRVDKLFSGEERWTKLGSVINQFGVSLTLFSKQEWALPPQLRNCWAEYSWC